MTPTLLEAAEMYISQGLVLVPMPHGTKAPTTDRWQDKGINTLEQARYILSRPQNIGLLHKDSKTVCLDIDDNQAFEVFDCLGLDLNTYLRDNTPKIKGVKGIKPVYKMPEGEMLEIKKLAWHWWENGQKKSKTIFELRGAGGQDVLPPSMHPSGITYEWLDGYPENYDDFKPLPQELLHLWQHWENYHPLMESLNPHAPFTAPKDKTKASPETLSLIEQYNQSISLGELLERNGYVRK